MQEYYEKLSKAWNETKERILVYEDHPAYTPYCRLTNGKTRDAKEALGTDQYPYLKSVDCAEDKDAEDAFQSKEIDGTGYEITKQDSAGYVLEIRQGEETMDGDTFRDRWELASSCYTLKEENKKTTVITQVSAMDLNEPEYGRIHGERGKRLQKDSELFFEGTVLKEVAEILKDTE